MTNAPPSPTVPEHWALDKKIPLAIIGTVLIQTLALGWWTSKLDSRVAQLEATDIQMLAERKERRKATDDKFDLLYSERMINGQRVAEMKAQIDFLVGFAKRVEQRWDREQGLPIQIPRNP